MALTVQGASAGHPWDESRDLVHVSITAPGLGRAQLSNCIMLVLELPGWLHDRALSSAEFVVRIRGYQGAAAMQSWAVDCSE